MLTKIISSSFAILFVNLFLRVEFLECKNSKSGLSGENSLIWGPGLRTNIVLPVRYFFIQAVDDAGNNFTTSAGAKPFRVILSTVKGDHVLYSIDILDRQDGSYIVRYRLHRSYKDLIITVTYKNKNVGSSPYTLQGYVYNDKCNCPALSFSKWLKTMGCPSSYKQIEADLKPWKDGFNMSQYASEAVKRFSDYGRHSICHYKIVNNKVFRKCYGEHIGFKMFSDAPLLSLARKVVLPDVEFFINLGDWPLEKRSVNQNPFPMFSWCGSDETCDIVMPTYDITESTFEMMARVSLDILSIQGNNGPAWENKTNLAFWRGRDSRQERLDLVVMGKKHPKIIDAALTSMFFFPKDEKKYGKLVKHISFFDFFKHKYQLNVDGTVAAYRFPYLLAGSSLVLKQDSHYYEHFYKELRPYVHYIPFKRDLSDLLKQVKWAREHDFESRQIAENGQEFVRNNLMPTDILCYHAVLFQKFSKIILSKPIVDSSFAHVDQPSDHDSVCSCQRKKKSNSIRTEL